MTTTSNGGEFEPYPVFSQILERIALLDGVFSGVANPQKRIERIEQFYNDSYYWLVFDPAFSPFGPEGECQPRNAFAHEIKHSQWADKGAVLFSFARGELSRLENRIESELKEAENEQRITKLLMPDPVTAGRPNSDYPDDCTPEQWSALEEQHQAEMYQWLQTETGQRFEQGYREREQDNIQANRYATALQKLLSRLKLLHGTINECTPGGMCIAESYKPTQIDQSEEQAVKHNTETFASDNTTPLRGKYEIEARTRAIKLFRDYIETSILEAFERKKTPEEVKIISSAYKRLENQKTGDQALYKERTLRGYIPAGVRPIIYGEVLRRVSEYKGQK